jgi:hypothetical protein
MNWMMIVMGQLIVTIQTVKAVGRATPVQVQEHVVFARRSLN